MSVSYPKAVLFDWDNTLVSSWGAIHAALEVTFKAMGQEPWTLEQTRQRVRASAREAFPKLFGARAEEATRIFYEAYERGHVESLNLMPGADALIESLASRDLFLGVVSNKTNYLLKAEVEHLGWDRHFGAVVGALDAARDKPAADPIHLALEGSGLMSSPDVWFVGDTDVDLQTAVAAGCHPVLLREQAPESSEFIGHEPALHVTDCLALLRLLER